MFASKCFGAILCHDGCSLRSRGSWLGGSLVSALSCVASAPCDEALGDFVVDCFGCFLVSGPALTWHRSCHLHASRCEDGLREGWHTSCYQNSSQEHIAVHLPSCLCGFFCCVVFCVFCFLWFLFLFVFLLVCARSRQWDSFMDYVKVLTSSLL